MKRTRRQALGQHFLNDPHVLRKILQQIAPDKEDVVIEIGAGKGVLTIPLAEKAGRVYAIEKDKSLIPLIQEKLPSNAILVEANILKIRFEDILAKDLPTKKALVEDLHAKTTLAGHLSDKKTIKLVGNLPYSISSPVLFKVLDAKALFEECTFLLQKEVADRIAAGPGSKKYAPISILFQRDYDARLCFVVEPGSFSPPPKVRSTLIQFKKRKQPLFEVSDEDKFRSFLRSAFRHRRKTLFNNLLMAGISESLLAEAFNERSFDKKVRPEHISPQGFAGLFNFLEKDGIIEA
jgi:16S rRNA (adenine1518-N6/adenine1519-N6)-dimethyltransferase